MDTRLWKREDIWNGADFFNTSGNLRTTRCECRLDRTMLNFSRRSERENTRMTWRDTSEGLTIEQQAAEIADPTAAVLVAKRAVNTPSCSAAMREPTDTLACAYLTQLCANV